jgi:Anti-sigma-28 factor, FlgM
MLYQVFPMTRAFNRQLRRHWRAEPYIFVARSQSEMDRHCARTDKGHPPRDCLLAPSLPDRADKIAQLRRAVENGDYCVSPEQIAEKMVQEALIAMFTS